MPAAISRLKGNGRNHVMLHGSMSSKALWSSYMKTLSRQCSLLSVDLLGYGANKCDLTGAQHSLATEASSVLGEIDARLGPEASFSVIAHSYGGAVALKIASIVPERVDKIIAFEPVAFFLFKDSHPARHSIRQVGELVTQHVKKGKRHEAVKAFLDYWSGPSEYDQLDNVSKQLLAIKVVKVPYDYRAIIGEAELQHGLANIKCPVILTQGQESRSEIYAINQCLRKHMSCVSIYTLPGNHFGLLDYKEQYISLLKQTAA